MWRKNKLSFEHGQPYYWGVRANSSISRVGENTEATQQNCHSKFIEIHRILFHVLVSFFRPFVWTDTHTHTHTHTHIYIYIYIKPISIYIWYANWLIYESTYILSNMHVLRTVYKNIFIAMPMSVLACDTFRFDHFRGKKCCNIWK